MKKLITILSLILITSCNSYKLSKTEFNKYSIKGNKIYYLKDSIAEYNNIQFEYYKGNSYIEISVLQYKQGITNHTNDLAKFIHQKHPNFKIEINLYNEITKK